MPEEEVQQGQVPEVKPEDVKPEGEPEAKPDGQVWKDGKPFDPAAAQALIEKLRKDEGAAEELARFKAQQAKEEEDRKIAAGESEEVAKKAREERDAAKAEAEAIKAELDNLNALQLKQVETMIEKWPPSIKKLIKISDDAKAVQLLEQVQELQESAEQLMRASAPPGSSPGPVAQGGLGGSTNTDAPRPRKYKV